MKQIKDTDIFGNEEPVSTIEDFVVGEIRSDYDGRVEQAGDIANQTLKLVGRLLQHLADNNQIAATQLATIVKGYNREQATFIE